MNSLITIGCSGGKIRSKLCSSLPPFLVIIKALLQDGLFFCLKIIYLGFDKLHFKVFNKITAHHKKSQSLAKNWLTFG